IVNNMLQIGAIQFVAAAVIGRVSKDDLKAAIPEIAGGEPVADREVLKFLLRRAAALPAEQKIAAVEKRFGTLTGDARVRAEDEFARKATENEKLTTEKGLTELIEMSADQMKTAVSPLSE